MMRLTHSIWTALSGLERSSTAPPAATETATTLAACGQGGLGGGPAATGAGG
jgi:hypothetical protein